MSSRHTRRIERQVRRDLSRPQKVSQSRRERRAEMSREGQRAWARRQRMMLESLRMPRWMVLFASLWLVVTLTCSPAFVVPHLIAASGGQLLVDVGSFTKINTVTTQAVTLNGGKTWTPKAIIFFSAGSSSASGTWFDAIYQMIGFAAAGPTDYGVGGRSTDNLATSDTARRMAAKALTLPDAAGTGVSWDADVQSFDAGGFTLNWTANVAASSVIGYIALGGDIQAEVLNWQVTTGTGNQSVSTGTIQPDLVFHMSDWASALGSVADVLFGFGAMNSSGEQWAVSLSSRDGQATSDTSRWQRTDSCIISVGTGDAQNLRVAHVSMDANGFTVNKATNAFGSSLQVASLCIKGVKSKLGAETTVTTAAPVTQSVTAPGFSPALVMTAAHGGAANTSPAAQAIFTLGASDGTNQRAVMQIDVDAVNPTRADSIWVSGKGYISSADTDGTPAVEKRADVNPTALGFDFAFDLNDSVAAQVLYAALAAKD